MILSRLKFSRNAILRYGQTISGLHESNSPIGTRCIQSLRGFHCSPTNHNENSPKKQNNAKQVSNILLKTAKGTRDYNPEQMVLRQRVFTQIENIFRKYGGQAIDTPVFERKELLLGKYGDDSKLIYDLEDQGGEILSLRYDLTVPLARYLAMNKINNIKRYHIAKVYRRDTPAITQGRLREFYQCDFDIVGSHSPMLADAECVKVMADVLESLNIGKFVIKLNHRQLLNGLFEACGVPEDKFKTICSSIDKLDKLQWFEVRKEMVEEKCLSEEAADKIGEYMQLTAHNELIDKLLQDEHLNKYPSSRKGLEDLQLLLKYCSLLGVQNNVIFDLSLARGLDYYTGVIFEAVFKDKKSKDVQSIGSIAAGGRYDELIGTLMEKGHSVPSVGISIGIERILSILEAKFAKDNLNLESRADVYVISAHKGLHEERLKIVNRLWGAGIRSEHSLKESPRLLHQIQYCEKRQIPFAILIGDSEIQQKIVKLRDINGRTDVDIPMDNFEEEVRKKIEIRLQ